MINFNYYAPTQVVFGRDTESQVAELVQKYGGTKVLIHYGGGSARKSGLLDRIEASFKNAGLPYLLLGGVKPNPRLSLVHEGVDLCRKEGVDFILAVGGGSVIDSSKAIAWGVPYEGDVWDFYTHKAKAKTCLPVAAVVAIPAAGSEMSDGSVITNEDGWLKKDYGDNMIRCKFAVMNPELTYTLPAWQTACGVTDIMMPTMERYFVHDDDMEVTTAIAEAILRTVKDCGYKIKADPNCYNTRAQIMWAGSLAHNDLTGCGAVGDWGTHNLEHELSGMFDVSHGAGLSALWGSWARYVMDENVDRFARFAVNVHGVTPVDGDAKATALKGVEAMEQFFSFMGMPVSIPELIKRPATEEEILEMAEKCSENGQRTVGNLKALDKKDMAAIYRMANK